jgi:hypothetical protein
MSIWRALYALAPGRDPGSVIRTRSTVWGVDSMTSTRITAAVAILLAVGATITGATANPASRYLLTVRDLPSGFVAVSKRTISTTTLNKSGAANFGTCRGRNYARFTAGAEAVFRDGGGADRLQESVQLATSSRGARRDAAAGFAHILACRQTVISGVTWSVRQAFPMTTTKSGARVGELTLTTVYHGVPIAYGIGIAQRGIAEAPLIFGPVAGRNVGLVIPATTSLLSRATAKLPSR